jgi:hypothetical protein
MSTIYDILFTTYINKNINIQMWNINLITYKCIYNKYLIVQQINYINKNIKKLYINHFIKYGIKNKLLKCCKFMSNHINLKNKKI